MHSVSPSILGPRFEGGLPVINSTPPFVDLIPVQLPNLALGVEGTNEGRIGLSRVVVDWKLKRVRWGQCWTITKG
jgi:hypothetical protein